MLERIDEARYPHLIALLILPAFLQLFDIDTDFAAAPDVFPPDKFNAGKIKRTSHLIVSVNSFDIEGVLVIKPSCDTFQLIMSLVESVQSYDGGDTGDF